MELAHFLVSSRLGPGDAAVDATVGNGHDTDFLAGQVGPAGTVLGFDLQEDAIRAARKKTEGASQVRLICGGHENLSAHLEFSPNAAMFNLGYLPGGDKSIVTRAETTIAALDQLCAALAKGGIITVVLYTGHPGGNEEAEAVRFWASSLDQNAFCVFYYQFLNRKNSPPSLIAIEKIE